MPSESVSLVGRLLNVALAVVLVPLIALVVLPVVLLWLLVAVAISALIWASWCTRGKDILFVYSDSPVWRDYIRERILPSIESRSMILNWSERRRWLHACTLSTLAFRHFGGYRESNPVAIHFRPFRRHRTFRFWRAFRDWKHGKPEQLSRIESDFFRAIGVKG